MCLCELIETETTKMNEEQLQEHHFEIILELAESAREVANIQNKVQALTHRIEEVELELEAREAKNQGNLN